MTECTADGAGRDPVPGERAGAVLGRCRQLASGYLEGIEDAADELVATAQGDRSAIEVARREVLATLARQPDDRVAKQMLSLLRRALERGQWKWDR